MSTMFLPPEKGDRRLFKLLFKWAQEQAKLQLGLERLGPVIYELESVLRWKVGDEITDELLSKLRYWFALVNSAHKRVFSRRRMLTQLESLAQIIRDASHVVGSADVRELLLRIGPNPPHPHWREAQSSEPIILNPEQQVSDQYKTHEDVQQAELELKKLRLGIGKPPFVDPSAMRVLVYGFRVSALACAGRGEAPTGARQRAANTAGARYSSDECGLASL